MTLRYKNVSSSLFSFFLQIVFLVSFGYVFTFSVSQAQVNQQSSEYLWPNNRNQSEYFPSKLEKKLSPVDSVEIALHSLGKPSGAQISRFYKITGKILLALTSRDGWYSSSDKGDTWEKLVSPDLDSLIQDDYYQFCSSPDSGFFCLKRNGMFYSPDYGKTWRFQSSRILSYLLFSPQDMLYSENDSVLCWSSDKGVTWNDLELPDTNTVSQICIIPDGSLYLIQKSSLSIFRLKDDKAGWEKVVQIVPTNYPEEWFSPDRMFYVKNQKLFIDVSSGRYYWYNLKNQTLEPLFYLPADWEGHGAILGYTSDGMFWARYQFFRSSDTKFTTLCSGDYLASWTDLGTDLGNQCPKLLDGGEFIVSVDDGFAKSFEGMRWTYVNKGLNSAVCVSMAVVDAKTIFVGTVLDFFSGGIHKYSGDQRWTRILRNVETDRVWEINYQIVQKNSKDEVIETFSTGEMHSDRNEIDQKIAVLYSQSNDNICKSLDNGKRWTQVNSLDYNPGSQYQSATFYAAYTDKKGMLYSSVNDWGIFHMNYDESLWKVGRIGFPYDYVFFIGEDMQGNILAKTWKSGKFFLSTDQGKSWTSASWNFPTPNFFCQAGSKGIFAGTDGGLYFSQDNCQNWDYVTGGQILKAVFLPQIKCLIIGKYEQGVFYTFDYGLSWRKIVGDYSLERIRDIETDLDNRVYFCTENEGIIATDYFKEQIAYSLIPDGIKIGKIFPNPSNMSFSISFSNDTPKKIKISLYDLLGRRLKTLSTNNYLRGYFTETFNISYFPSGSYVIRIESGSQSEVTKISIVK